MTFFTVKLMFVKILEIFIFTFWRPCYTFSLKDFFWSFRNQHYDGNFHHPFYINTLGYFVHDKVETLKLPILLHQNSSPTIKISSIMLKIKIIENEKLIELLKPTRMFLGKVGQRIKDLHIIYSFILDYLEKF